VVRVERTDEARVWVDVGFEAMTFSLKSMQFETKSLSSFQVVEDEKSAQTTSLQASRLLNAFDWDLKLSCESPDAFLSGREREVTQDHSSPGFVLVQRLIVTPVQRHFALQSSNCVQKPS